jgi:two-component system heavy metal sensor histidine kinase CusS
MARVSIRLRLAMWYSTVLLLGLVLFGCAMWFALQHRLIEEMDSRLTQQAEGLRAALEDEGVLFDRRQIQEEVSEAAVQNPKGSSIQLRMKNGELISAPTDPPPPTFEHLSTEPAYHTMDAGGRLFRSFSRRIQCRTETFDLLIVVPLDDFSGILGDFRMLLIMMIPGVLAMACLGGWWISKRALAPVDEITKVAKSITARNLSKRLAVPRTGDELQRMSEAWNEVLERLEAAAERTRRLTADASHELRTPVALIRSTAELALRRDRTLGDYCKALRQIEAEAQRMTTLINELLYLAAADSDSIKMTFEPLDLNRLAAEMVQENAALAESKGVCVRADLPAETGEVIANEAAIRRLLRILIDNAVKFTPAGGLVVVSTTGGDRDVTLSVRDSGSGITAEAQSHIFERFYRADPSHGDSSGAGLGLSIAQMIAKAHGSAIRVESSPGRGSCFSLMLKN